MTWVRLDDGFADHPKIEQVGPLAAWLHVTALCYCARHSTDGHVPKAKAARLAHVPQPAKRIDALVAAGMWHDAGATYVLHDYLEYQPSKEQVEAERGKARDRMAKARQQRSPEQVANTNGDDARMFARTSHNPVPTRPDPSPNGVLLPVVSPVTPAVIDDRDFDDFWRAYPAKKGKPAARKAWDRAVKRAAPEAIIAGAHRYAADPDRDPSFTKWPQGWLNEDRWEDEPVARPLRVSKQLRDLQAWGQS